ncbi:MAG TPA: hypothetical protein VF308_16660 [Caldimonas sp.]
MQRTSSASGRISSLAAAAAVAAAGAFLASSPAQAAEGYKFTCQGVGMSTVEPVGDRDGHAVSVGEYSCRAESGRAEGGIVSGANTWERDKGVATLLAGDGVIRKPGSIAVYQFTEGKNAFTMADGKVTGYEGEGKFLFKQASGVMAPWAGKVGTLKWHSIPGGMFTGEVIIDN